MWRNKCWICFDYFWCTVRVWEGGMNEKNWKIWEKENEKVVCIEIQKKKMKKEKWKVEIQRERKESFIWWRVEIPLSFSFFLLRDENLFQCNASVTQWNLASVYFELHHIKLEITKYPKCCWSKAMFDIYSQTEINSYFQKLYNKIFLLCPNQFKW